MVISMRNKGFTLVEVLVTLFVLGVIVSISIVFVNINVEKSYMNSEKIYIDSLRDALKIYIDSDGKNLDFNDNDFFCSFQKSLGSVEIYESTNEITFSNVVNSRFKPLLEEEMVNPGNKDGEQCDINTSIRIFRDDDFVYYYYFDMDCLKYTRDAITNLPEECLKKIENNSSEGYPE